MEGQQEEVFEKNRPPTVCFGTSEQPGTNEVRAPAYPGKPITTKTTKPPSRVPTVGVAPRRSPPHLQDPLTPQPARQAPRPLRPESSNLRR